jgi:hypothetical protein
MIDLGLEVRLQHLQAALAHIVPGHWRLSPVVVWLI